MRTKLRSKVTLLFLTLGLLLAVPAVAIADNLQDSITSGSQKKTIATGAANSFENSYWVEATGSDSSPGCDVSSTAPATFKLNVPTGVTASSTDTFADGSPKLVFTGCSTATGTANKVPVTFSSNTPGVYNITASYDSGGVKNADTFNESPSNLELTVVGVTSVSPADGATNVAVGTDVTATFSQDVTGANSSSNFKLVKDGDLTNTPVSAALSYSAVSKTATLNPNSDLEQGTKYNATLSGVTFGGVTLETKTWSFTTAAPPPPACTNPADPVFSHSPDGSNGWFKTIPAVSASSSTASATVQYSLNAAGPFSNTAPVLTEGETTVYAKAISGTCSSNVTSQLYKVDITAPTINDGGTTQTPNGALWFNTAVINNFSATDATSGLADASKANFSVSSGLNEGSSVKINSGPVSDLAGNTNLGIDSAAFKIDRTAPTVSVTGVSNSATYTIGAVPTAGCSTTDALSGPDQLATVAVTGGTLLGIGNFTATCSGGTDVAGNSQAAPVSVSYKVVTNFSGFFSPVDTLPTMNSAKAGQAIPLKWRITDSGGNPITNLSSVTVRVESLSCSQGTSVDALEEYAAGSSGLQNLGNGNYQFNWKTPTSYASSCKTLHLDMGEGLTRQAAFKFTK